MVNDELLAQVAALNGTALLILLTILIVLLLPIFLVMFSRRIHGGKKLLWVVLMATFSWLAWPRYLSMLRKLDKAAAAEPEAEKT